MAATQAEPQQNDVNREIVSQEQSPLSANNSLQNGTEKISGRGVVGSDVGVGKGIKPAQNISVDMSQYRQDSGPPVNNSEQNANNSEDSGGKINNSEKPYSHNSEQSASDVNYGKCPPDSGQNMQGYGIPYPQRGNFMHPDAGNPIHMGADPMHHQSNSYAHFNPGMRHSYPGSKPLPVPARPPSGGPVPSTGFPPHSQQQRFMAGQNIASPPTGPTPTLNQLLQSSNSVHNRYPNSYGDYGMPKTGEQPPSGMAYNQNWTSPRPMGPYTQPGPYRNQPPMGPGGGSNGGYERVGSWSPGPAGQLHEHPASPQPTQQGSYPARPSPNPHAPDPSELTGQNSNDSSSGGGGGGTPNSQGGGGPLRPSPSPTGSSGSRSMSPAVLPTPSNQQQQQQQQQQQSVVMPPRPSSGQSDSGNGSNRLSHSPMANQVGAGGYQGSGAHYKMASGGGMMAHMPPQSQQVPPYSPQPSHHQYPPQQANYRAAPMAGYPGQPYQGPAQAQYPPHRPTGPPIPNHVQYPPYQHKVAYGSGMPPSPGSYNSQTMGPPPGALHPGMPPPPPPHHDGPMPPPPSTPSELHENAVTTTAQTGTVSSSSNNSGGPGGVTSIVTTGPDGASIDEASQQSTLSNASAASGDDSNVTPGKSRSKEGMVYQSSHPTTPQSTAPSPGAASLNSIHEEYPPDHSPTWSRTPNSPHDSLSKLYEMDETVDRRMWLDKLLQFMEERGSPISACPTISKNPLDLFRLYILVKERGGFMEVCKVTKNKVWKDIAGLLGIGASSSAAYTLRKHYTKNLLPYECHFDRGGIDPQPIINQVEATSKKKSTKTAPVPSPGSSNSQDSFQGPGSGGSGMDGSGYSGYGYPQEYSNQRPPSQSNQGVQQGYPGQGGYGQYGEQYGQAYGGYPGRPVYPGYGEPDRGYPGGQQDQYGRYMGGYPPRGGAAQQSYPQPGQGTTPPGGSNQSTTPPQGSSAGSGNSGGGGTSPAPAAPTPPAAPAQDYYRPTPPGGAPPPDPNYPAQPYPAKAMPPPQPGPRRHPDFVKDQAQQQQQPPPGPPQPPYPYSQPHRPPPPPNIYPGWPNNSGGQYRGSYPGGGWGGSGSRPSGPPPPSSGGQWGSPGYQPGWAPPQSRPPRPPPPGHPFRPDSQSNHMNSKPFSQMAPPPGIKGPGMSSFGPQGSQIKRELIFPPDSVEGTSPILYKRRRLTKADVAPIEAWRIMMALKSGLLAETTWALDVLNILLFDDSSVAYFGLLHLPGLLDILLEHMKKALSEMLEPQPGHPAQWFETAKDPEPIDLGAVCATPDPSDRVNILKSTPDMTLRSRKGHPVNYVPAQDDIFITDGRRPWDSEESQEEPGDHDLTKYIVTCFRSEICNIPFTRKIAGPHKTESNDESLTPKSAPPSPLPTLVQEDTKPCDKVCKKKNKSLSYVLSRIKKESSEQNGECFEKEETTKKSETEETVVKEEVVEEPKVKEEAVCKIRDPAGTLKRRRMSDYEDECYTKDEASLYLVTESQDCLARRCICISTILRNLSFVPGNESEFAKSGTFLCLVGKLLLLHHEHPPRAEEQQNYDRDEDADFTESCSSLQGESEWWWEFLHHLRENALVSLANICGQVDLGLYPEDVSRPILDGLLHWAVCPAAHGQDPFPTVSSMSSLSPQRLALESLCKLCVTDSNVDLVIATPPYCRLERLASVLTRLLCRSEEQVLREFGVNLLYYLGAADSGMARTIALQTPCVSLLVGFMEQAEAGAVGVANTQGIVALRDNPDSAMGTSVDMVRRCARALLALARHPANRALLAQQESRLLQLVMSQVLDQSTAATLARVLYQVSRQAAMSPPPPDSSS